LATKKEENNMKNFLSDDEMMVDLRGSSRWDLSFKKDYLAFNNTNHEFESINAKFFYIPFLEEQAANVEDWDTFKNYIASDFSKLKYPPCHLYVGRLEVTATWFTPDAVLINGIGNKEKLLVMNNLEEQLMELKFCMLVELEASEGDRDVEEDLFLEYYRKRQFLDSLLSKDFSPREKA
jgi:hypothetical protein